MFKANRTKINCKLKHEQQFREDQLSEQPFPMDGFSHACLAEI